MSRCRLCGTVRMTGDPCPGAYCPKNTGLSTQIRPARSRRGERVATQRNGSGVTLVRLIDGPQSLHGQTYVADYDGTHFYQ